MKLTILMYHKIHQCATRARHPGNYVAPGEFERQMDALLAWGYRTIALDQWLAYRDGRGAAPPEHPLIVTFDDGYTCFGRHAWPVLRARGMGATVFLVAGQIGGTNAWDVDERQEPLLDADAIRSLQGEGVSFGSHGVHHVPLARVPRERALDELAQSRAILRDVLGHAPDVFAYPYSNQSRAVRSRAARAGYRAALRGGGRMNSRRTGAFGLYRIKVEQDWRIADLEMRLRRERRRVF